MAEKTFNLFKKFNNHVASMNGSTQIRAGVIRPEIVIPINEGWNLISGISTEINIDIIDSELVISGSMFGFDGEYFEPQYIEPGKGYWLRCISDGQINISAIH